MLKKELFEYVVYKIDQWYKEAHEGQTLQITKLRLQKILLACADHNHTLRKPYSKQILSYLQVW